MASTEKTLHANPGKHGDIPAFELDSTLRFFARQLGLVLPAGAMVNSTAG